MLFQTNCRHWVGHKPCKENRLCPDCPEFEPLGPRILIIKLAARGDVLRTTALERLAEQVDHHQADMLVGDVETDGALGHGVGNQHPGPAPTGRLEQPGLLDQSHGFQLLGISQDSRHAHVQRDRYLAMGGLAPAEDETEDKVAVIIQFETKLREIHRMYRL